MLATSHYATVICKKDSFVNLSKIQNTANEMVAKSLKEPTPNYSPQNYEQSSQKNGDITQSLKWGKTAVVKGPLIVPSLYAIRFQKGPNGKSQSLLNAISGTRDDIVQYCAVDSKYPYRIIDRMNVKTALQNVNNAIKANEAVRRKAIERTQRIEASYKNFIATEDALRSFLKTKCQLTADNNILGVYFNNTLLSLAGNKSNWYARKTFEIDNFKDGKVFACKCSNYERNSADTEYNHSRTAGLIVKSEDRNYFSTYIISDKIKQYWKVYHNTTGTDPPKDKNGNQWYENGFDDSAWNSPVKSESAFYLDRVASESQFKIWGGKKGNKYVWFRYKER